MSNLNLNRVIETVAADDAMEMYSADMAKRTSRSIDLRHFIVNESSFNCFHKKPSYYMFEKGMYKGMA